jgi:peroxiredoxin
MRSGRCGSSLQITGLPGLPPVAFSAFINEQTQLFEEVSVDMTAMFRAFAKEQEQDEVEDAQVAELLIAFQDVVVDAAVPEDAFAFHPAPVGARKVARFGFVEDPIATPLDLLGREAPDLSGSTLTGETFDLRAQRGRVVVLAFWATCCPGVGGFLDQLEGLARAHKDDPLTVVAVNRNSAAGQPAVQRLLAERSTEFVQLLDREGEDAEAWHLTGLPTVFLLDQEGTIAEACLTWNAESCARQVASLLKSEPLYSPEQQRVRQATAGETLGGTVLQAPTTQPAAGRLLAADSQAVSGSRWNMSEQDIDGDGELELVLPGWTGDLNVIKPSTGEVTKVPLRGLGRGSATSVCAVRIEGETCWLCASQDPFPATAEQRLTRVRLYAPGGEIVWTFQPPVPEKRSSSAVLAAGDLDGDGAVEFAIGLTTYTLRPMNENTWTRDNVDSHLLILDSQGRLIQKEELPSQIELVYIGPSKSGHPAPLLCLAGGELLRFTLTPQQ